MRRMSILALVLDAVWQRNGRIDAMKTTIDAAGRIVVPKAIRERLGLTGGEVLDLVEHDGTIEITAAPAELALVERGGVLVATPARELPPLTDDDIRAALERGRR